jgi:CTP synthase (UTP-ammonia lyase)
LQERIKSVKPKVVILSGGPNSVHVEGSPRVPDEFFSYCSDNNIPVLGICYGMQLIVQVCMATQRSSCCNCAAEGIVTCRIFWKLGVASVQMPVLASSCA